MSLEAGVHIVDSNIKNCIIGANSIVKNAVIESSMLGKNVTYIEKPKELSLGDFSTQL